MKQLFLTLLTSLLLQNTNAQLGPVELMAGNRYLHYQHSFAQPLKPESKFGWQHVATFVKRYHTNTEKGGMPDELMNQAYITFRTFPLLTVKGGLFYTNAGSYQPTAGLQFLLRKKNWVTIVAPRIDLKPRGSYEMFVVLEFFPSIAKNTKLYTRLQAMSNWDSENHNRSDQQVRIGLDLKGFQLGGGITLDEYGTAGVINFNSGVFVRRPF